MRQVDVRVRLVALTLVLVVVLVVVGGVSSERLGRKQCGHKKESEVKDSK